ncbi:hypothetical protein WA026_000949 [Henosepilachna vigintioctopunctata]|uniref:Bystin n=1 Tax=Henosepilachna vigintioctopunctata TaxID=420089 RepID=A0AAW1V8W5_9CUCU
MGKTKKFKPSQIATKVPLDKDIEEAQFAQPKNRVKTRHRQNEDEEYIRSGLSRKILDTARKQQRELEGPASSGASVKFHTTQLGFVNDSDEDEEDALESEIFYDNIDVNPEDEKAIEKFMSSNPAPRRYLADAILEKLTEKKTELEKHFSDNEIVQIEDLNPAVKKLYEGVGDVLKNYRSGVLPKSFKFIPSTKNWEQILCVTDPTKWSAAAMYQGTRLFVSNLTETKAQKFLNLVLLPRIRDDIAEYKRLNFHLYQALRKSLYKPKAFMKGLLIPLLESGDCSLREAIIIGSIVAKYTIPVEFSAPTILKIAEMDYTGTNSIFLRIFFDKKYALPYRVVDSVVEHFLRFQLDPRDMPVLWHQAFLTFVQRYKNVISNEQKDALLKLSVTKSHASITPEILRELTNSKCVKEVCEEPKMDFD